MFKYPIDAMNVNFKIALFLFSLVGTSSFVVLSFVKSEDCSQLVIDTYEMHSDINIPHVSFVNCYYDEELNLRISVYDLEESLDLSRFAPISNQMLGALVHGLDLLNSAEIPSANRVLFYAAGQKWGRDWTFIYDQNTDRLWAELRY